MVLLCVKIAMKMLLIATLQSDFFLFAKWVKTVLFYPFLITTFLVNMVVCQWFSHRDYSVTCFWMSLIDQRVDRTNLVEAKAPGHVIPGRQCCPCKHVSNNSAAIFRLLRAGQ